MPKMLNVKEVSSTLGVCRATLYNLIKKGKFPPGRRISDGRVGWLSTDVVGWMEAR